MQLTPLELASYGLADHHIVPRAHLPAGVNQSLHTDVIAPFLMLQMAARGAGFDMQIVSGFRSFERQLAIWNGKANGSRAVLNERSQIVDMTLLSDADQALAIMRWSALPGCSRHHWGTDFDIYDAAAVDSDYEVQLIPEEVSAGGAFAPLHEWLDRYLESGSSGGFFRPYAADRGGIAPERWHLSYAPVAGQYEAAFSLQTLTAVWRAQQIALVDAVVAMPAATLQRYLPRLI
jgi:LAS superfamily LD-carboxypeptidase LdcB